MCCVVFPAPPFPSPLSVWQQVSSWQRIWVTKRKENDRGEQIFVYFPSCGTAFVLPSPGCTTQDARHRPAFCWDRCQSESNWHFLSQDFVHFSAGPLWCFCQHSQKYWNKLRTQRLHFFGKETYTYTFAVTSGWRHRSSHIGSGAFTRKTACVFPSCRSALGPWAAALLLSGRTHLHGRFGG